MLTHRRGAPAGEPDATVSIERTALNEVLGGDASLEDIGASGRLAIEGDGARLAELLGLLDPPDPRFPIVTR